MTDAKLLPHSEETEQSLLGALLMMPELLDDVRAVINRDMFYSEMHAKIFDGICEVYEAGVTVDVTTVGECLFSKFKMEEWGGPAYLSTTIDLVPTPKAAVDYASIVHEKYLLRSIINISVQIRDAAYDSADKPFDLIEKVSQEYQSLVSTKSSDDIRRISQFDKSIEQYNSTDTKIMGITSGFKEIDEDVTGWQKGELIVLMGRPETYKTFMQAYWVYQAYLEGAAVAVIELEMNLKKTVERIEAFFAKVNSKKIRRKTLDEDEHSAYMGLKEVFNKRNNDVFILTRKDVPTCSPSVVASKIRQLKPDILFIDSILSMDVDKSVSGERERVVRNVRSLKRHAEAFEIPIIALHHTSKAKDNSKTFGKASKDASMESDVIAQDTDVLFHIQRDEYLDAKKQVFFGTAKNRDDEKRNYLMYCDMSVPAFAIDLAGEGDILQRENSEKPKKPSFAP